MFKLLPTAFQLHLNVVGERGYSFSVSLGMQHHTWSQAKPVKVQLSLSAKHLARLRVVFPTTGNYRDERCLSENTPDGNKNLFHSTRRLLIAALKLRISKITSQDIIFSFSVG